MNDKILETYKGKKVWVWAANFIYYGILTDWDNSFLLLDEPFVVFETGELTAKSFKEAHPLPHAMAISRNAIESFGEPRQQE